ncbi:MAG: fructosamine kinase family protein [Opitutales bacterium]|nr:fructosamine kinase family protein [Opitutales bacterium]
MDAGWAELCQRIGKQLGKDVEPRGTSPLAGGCIHNASRLETSAGTFFVKRNTAHCLEQFEAEAESLRAMAATGTIRVPRPILAAEAGGGANLVLEYIEFGSGGGDAARRMGRELAQLHAVPQESFGWTRDNFIGPTPQPNPPVDDWPSFFRDHRLGWQFELLAKQGVQFRRAEALLERLDRFFEDEPPQPSLLHGDLWGGNAGYAADGTPVVFDPAAYRGHDEADLAMTELFGGFPAAFYEGYHAVRPKRAGYHRRRELYNLYHILNHALLFGGGYAAQAESMIDRLARG